jgi:hypothetical protein
MGFGSMPEGPRYPWGAPWVEIGIVVGCLVLAAVLARWCAS